MSLEIVLHFMLQIPPWWCFWWDLHPMMLWTGQCRLTTWQSIDRQHLASWTEIRLDQGHVLSAENDAMWYDITGFHDPDILLFSSKLRGHGIWEIPISALSGAEIPIFTVLHRSYVNYDDVTSYNVIWRHDDVTNHGVTTFWRGQYPRATRGLILR